MTNAIQREAEIRQRLCLLAKEYSHAELAVRSGFPRSTISHYFGTCSIPAAFCAALARSLGLSPEWLILGKGEAYAGISSSRGDKIVTELTRLLGSRNILLRQRLHAVNDGRIAALLLESGTLRQEQKKAEAELDGVVCDICPRLATISRDLVSAMQFVSSRSILEVSERLARLTNNHAIHATLAQARSYVEISTGHLTECVVASRKARQFRMMANVRDIFAETGQVADLVIITNAAGATQDAHRVAETMLAHYKYDLDGRSQHYLRLVAYRGSIGLHLGTRVGRKFRELAMAYSRLNEPFQSGMRIQYMTAMLDIGCLTPKEFACAELPRLPAYRPLTREFLYFTLLRYAASCERLDDLKMIEKAFSNAQSNLRHERVLLAHRHGDSVIDALEGRVKRAVATMERSPLIRRHCESVEGALWLYVMAARCHVLRLAGQTNRAHKLHMETDRQLEHREIVDALVVRALHYLNALHLIKDRRSPLLKRARGFFRTLLANGYHGYRDAFVQACVTH